MTATLTPPAAPTRPGRARRLSRWLDAHPRVKLGGLLTGPVAWLLVAYIGALLALMLNALYHVDPFTSAVVHKLGTDNFHRLFTDHVYRAVTIRTIGIAAAVTVIDFVIALPLAFFMAKVASARTRGLLYVAILMPLWASYLVKAYAWRAFLDPASGVLKTWFHFTPGFSLGGTILVLAYLWLPYMILPLYAGLERLPNSLLEASADLGGKAGRTFRSVVVPMLFPAVIAGSIFTFSLSLGDYVAVKIVGGTTQVIGTVVYDNVSVDLPFSAAMTTVPVVIMVIYLLSVRRSGALENL
jgi:putative spermidine/putrescine transport system permease protein